MGSSFPTQILTALIVNILIGWGLIFWGRRARASGRWLAMFAQVVQLAVGIVGWTSLSRGSYAPQSWVNYWIGEGAGPRSIQMGFSLELSGIVVTVFLAALSLIFLSSRKLISDEEEGNERIYAALCFLSTGCALTWTSLTVWMGFFGIFLASMGTFWAIGGSVERDNEQAKVATQFAWQSGWGLVLSVLGACILVIGGTELRWDQRLFWLANEPVFLGALLLVWGILIQVRPFPFLGVTLKESCRSYSLQLFATQIAPSIAAFAILFRMESALRSIGIIDAIGLSSTVLAIAAIQCGLFQDQWKKTYSILSGTIFPLALGIIAFAGASPAFVFMMTSSIALLALAQFVQLSSSKGGEKNDIGFSIVVVISFLIILGFPGFGPAQGWTGFFHGLSPDWVTSTWAVLVGLGFHLLAWKAFLLLKREVRCSEVKWDQALLGLFWIIMSLAVLWTGSLSGGYVFSNQDTILWSLMNRLSFSEGLVHTHANTFYRAIFLVAGTLAFGGLISFWLRNSWKKSSESSFLEFFSSGYHVDEIAIRYGNSLKRSVERVDSFFVNRLALEAVPRWVQGVLDGLSPRLGRLSLFVNRVLDSEVRRGVRVPAKALQLIQSGDLQWYLCLALASGMAILVHFMRI